eukprot:scaffold150620_cov35-Tisochrysis_lutea.AAC.1
MQERDAEILEDLREIFHDFVNHEYPGVDFNDIIKLTASHYFGIVPLHTNQKHQLAYLETCKVLLSSITPLG